MKKLSIFCLCTTIYLSSTAQVKETYYIKEDFSNNSANWLVGKNAGVTMEIINGKYVIENLDGGITSPAKQAIFNPDDDFFISTTAIQLKTSEKASGYGLNFWAKDPQNGYCFTISNGKFSFYTLSDNNLKYLISWTSNPAIKTETNASNKLVVKKDKDNWNFFVNEVQVGTYKAQKGLGLLFGPDVEGNQQVAFDDFVVKKFYVPKLEKIPLCVIENGVLKTIQADYVTDSYDMTATINGKKYTFWYDTPPNIPGYVRKEQWYTNHEAIEFKGMRFVKWGLPKIVAAHDVKKVGEYKSFGVYSDSITVAKKDTIKQIYLPTSVGCEWQMYVAECPSIQLKIDEPSVFAGDTITVTADVTTTKNSKFSWTTSAGIIIKGQGTKSVQIVTVAVPNFMVDITMQITPKLPGCSSAQKTSVRVRPARSRDRQDSRTPRPERQ